MRTRLLLALGVIALLGIGTFATSGDMMGAEKQWALVNVTVPTRISDTILFGPYLFVHDDSKTPCTTIYAFNLRTGARRPVVSFECVRGNRAVPTAFRLTGRRDLTFGTGATLSLLDYQFAGDAITHAVPTTVR